MRGEQQWESTGETDYNKARQCLKHRLREIGADVIGAKKFVGPRNEKLTVAQKLDFLKKDLEVRKKQSPQAVSKMIPVRKALGPMAAISVSDDTIREYMLSRLKGDWEKSKNPDGTGA